MVILWNNESFSIKYIVFDEMIMNRSSQSSNIHYRWKIILWNNESLSIKYIVFDELIMNRSSESSNIHYRWLFIQWNNKSFSIKYFSFILSHQQMFLLTMENIHMEMVDIHTETIHMELVLVFFLLLLVVYEDQQFNLMKVSLFLFHSFIVSSNLKQQIASHLSS